VAEIKVRTNGQTLRVNASVSHWTTAALAVTASGTNDVESTTTTTITADYSLHFANTATTATVTVSQLDGTTLLSQTFEVNPGVGLRVLNPVPDAHQTAVDVSLKGQFLPTGALASTIPRQGTNIGNVSLLTSGTMALTAIELQKGTVVTNISYHSATTATNTPTAWWFALYTADRALCAQTADQTSTAWGANTLKTLALTAPFTTTYTGLHYVGIMVAASTPPTLYAQVGAAYTNIIAPILTGNSTASLTTTAPATADAITVGSNFPYSYIT
jgi:hypothetical protein